MNYRHRVAISFTIFSNILTLGGCSIYKPFGGKSSIQDYLDAADQCLHDNDYACAIENYTAMPDSEIKSEKICTAYLGKGGVKLTVVQAMATQSSTTQLGDMSNSMIPWSAEKQTDLESAKTFCKAFKTAYPTSGTAVLLDGIAKMGHCSMLMAKTDQFVATSVSDTSCSTAGGNNGRVTQSDIGDAGGTITSTGMCTADVTACKLNLAGDGTSANDGLSESQLRSAGLTAIADAVAGLPDELISTATSTETFRSSLRSNTPSS